MAKSSEHISKKELKQDSIIGFFDYIFNYIGLHSGKFIIAFVAFLAIAGIYVSLEKVKYNRQQSVFKSLYEAKKSLENNEEVKAIAKLNLLVKKYPKSVEAVDSFLILFKHYFDKSEYQMCVDLSKLMLKKGSRDSSVMQIFLSVQALSFEQMAEYEFAIKSYERLIAMQPSSYSVPDTLLALARCYKSLQKIEKSKEIYQKLINEYPDTDWGKKASMLMYHI